MEINLFQFNTSTDRNLLPLASGVLSSYLKNDTRIKNHHTTNISILREDPYDIVDKTKYHDIFAFSVYVWNLQHSLNVAMLLKTKYPTSKVIFGGPSSPRKPDAIKAFFKKNEFADILVHGEGEITFSDLVHNLNKRLPLETVLGISFRSGNKIINTEKRERIRHLDIIPSPFLDGTFDKMLSEYGNLITGTIWETNRGCPFSCSFCDWGAATQSKIFNYSEDRLYQELDWISENKIFYIYAADANFGIRHRDKLIAEHMGKLKMKNGYPGYFMINWMKNSHKRTIEIAEVLRKHEIGSQVTLSMQSFDEETLANINRANIKLSTFHELKEDYNKRGISTYTELLLGLPGETYDSFSKGIVKALSPYSKDHFNIYLVRILENAELSKKEYRQKYKLKTRFCEVAMARRINDKKTVYESEEIIVSSINMNINDWKKSFIFGYFVSTVFNLRLLNLVILFLNKHYKISIINFIEYLISSNSKGTSLITDNLKKFTKSILNREMSVLPVEEFGERLWEPHEASFLICNMNNKIFYSSIQSLTQNYLRRKYIKYDQDLLNEFFVFQSLLSPLINNSSRVEKYFNYDILDYVKNIAIDDIEIIKRGNTLEFNSKKSNNNYASYAEFAINQLALSNSETLGIGDVDYVRTLSQVAGDQS